MLFSYRIWKCKVKVLIDPCVPWQIGGGYCLVSPQNLPADGKTWKSLTCDFHLRPTSSGNLLLFISLALLAQGHQPSQIRVPSAVELCMLKLTFSPFLVKVNTRKYRVRTSTLASMLQDDMTQLIIVLMNTLGASLKTLTEFSAEQYSEPRLNYSPQRDRVYQVSDMRFEKNSL